MKVVKIIVALSIFLFLAAILVGGYFGLIPGISTLLGTDKPKNLGIRYTQADEVSARTKSQIEYLALPPNSAPEKSLVFSGSREVNTQFSSAEITALFNNQPWKYWPYASVQVKFNADGSAEISGTLLKDKLPAYCAYLGLPKEATDFVMKYLPSNPNFFVKGRASLENNEVAIFEPQAFELNHLPLPVDLFLSFAKPSIAAYAADSEMISDLSKVSNKKALIISYINQRIAQKSGFFAQKAFFAEDKLVFVGKLSEKEASVR